MGRSLVRGAKGARAWKTMKNTNFRKKGALNNQFNYKTKTKIIPYTEVGSSEAKKKM